MQALPAGGRQSPERHSALLLSSPANQEAGGRRPQSPEASALLASEGLGRARMGSAKARGGFGGNRQESSASWRPL